jgi:hypothetical protein
MRLGVPHDSQKWQPPQLSTYNETEVSLYKQKLRVTLIEERKDSYRGENFGLLHRNKTTISDNLTEVGTPDT